jgi:hypothetical protein
VLEKLPKFYLIHSKKVSYLYYLKLLQNKHLNQITINLKHFVIKL